ncbi:uncharacterized protein LOC144158967 [Haemaphysalis longicornis]
MLQPLQPLQPGNYTVIFTNDAMATVPRVVPQHRVPRQRSPQRGFYRKKKFPADEFIEAVREHKFLYDHNEPDFRNTAKKEAVWEVIGDQFGISGSKAMSKWRNMRDTYFKIHKQKMDDRRRNVTPENGRPVKVWALYHKMRQIFGVKQTSASNISTTGGTTSGDTPPSEGLLLDSQGAATSHRELLTVTWPRTNVADMHNPELPSSNADATLHLDDSPTISVKQEPMEEIEMTISEHEASEASGCENSEHEDESTMASMQHSISVARSLFKLRRKEFKNAVKDFEAMQQHPTVVMCSSLPTELSSLPQSGPGNMCSVANVTPPSEVVNTTSPTRSEAGTQTLLQQEQVGSGSRSASDVTKSAPSRSPALAQLSMPSASFGSADGLEHFGLFVAQRMRMMDAAMQARLMSTILNLVLETPSG